MISIRSLIFEKFNSKWFLPIHFTKEQGIRMMKTTDPVRYGTVSLAIYQIKKDNIPGDFAECGVWKGSMSKFIREQSSETKLYLFDTFEGFDLRDSDTHEDKRFKDTSVETVLNRLGSSENIIIRKGFFPETSKGLEDNRFGFVLIDFDKYEPTLEALKFFYPRVNRGGFIMVHDVNSPESDWACSRALNEFLMDKPERPISIPDSYGSVLFRKI